MFTAGRYGHGVSLTVVDDWLLERLAPCARLGSSA
jgi:hypothetical protein